MQATNQASIPLFGPGIKLADNKALISSQHSQLLLSFLDKGHHLWHGSELAAPDHSAQLAQHARVPLSITLSSLQQPALLQQQG